jgi:hypothetical protein
LAKKNTENHRKSPKIDTKMHLKKAGIIIGKIPGRMRGKSEEMDGK